jgi:hypothetical protein
MGIDPDDQAAACYTPGRRPLYDRMPESSVEAHVRSLAQWYRLDVAYHPHDSRRSAAGWPDWVLIGPHGALFRELKGSTGRTTAEQTRTLAAMVAAGLDADVWTPEDVRSGRIEAEIRAISRRRGARKVT